MTKEKTELSVDGEDSSRTELKADTPFDGNIVMRWAMKGAVDRLIRVFEDEEDPFREEIGDMLNERDVDGKCPLDLAATLGRDLMIREMVERGAEVNTASGNGYTPLHHAAVWGRVTSLKALVASGADIHAKTSHGERARDTAARYNNVECVDYLDWAEARQALEKTVQDMRELLTDPERHMGRLDKPDKQLVMSSCQEKEDWLNVTSDPTTQDLISQRTHFTELMAPIHQKISEPPPEKTK